MLSILFYLMAFVVFVLAVFGVNLPVIQDMVALGLSLWLVAILISVIPFKAP